MKPTLSLSPAPSRFDTAAQDLFTAEGAPAPAARIAARIARPALLSVAHRHRMPLWHFFDKRGY